LRLARRHAYSYTRRVGTDLLRAKWMGDVGPQRLKGVRMLRRKAGEDGAAAVEFGLIVIPFCALLFGLIQFGWYFWTAETTNSAAREVARRVVVGDCWTAADRDAFAATHARQITGSVDVSPAPSGLAVGDKITITITSNTDLIDFIPGLPDSVTRSYEARMEVDAASSPDNCG
jgi:Flp pilus assembly protein TadG